MVLDGHFQQVVQVGVVPVHVGGGDGAEDSGEGQPGGNLIKTVGGGGQHVGYSLGRQAGHFLHATHQNDVVKPRRYRHYPFPQGAAAAGAGVLDAGYGHGGQSQPIGDDGRGVALMLKEIGGVIAHVGALDVLNVDALVQVVQHVLEGLNEQVPAVFVRKGPEPGHPGPNDGYRPS